MAAELGVGWVAMHMQGTPADMQRRPHYDDVVAEVHDFLLALAEPGPSAGVGEVWVDPGIGFGKTPEHNLSLLGHVGELVRRRAPGRPPGAGRDEPQAASSGASRGRPTARRSASRTVWRRRWPPPCGP